MSRISDGCGTHFDPDVVDAFFSAKGKILAIREEYKDEGESLLTQRVGQEVRHDAPPCVVSSRQGEVGGTLLSEARGGTQRDVQ